MTMERQPVMSAVAPVCHRSGRPAGFTLVELLVVIAIIGMVVALAVPTVFSAVRTARNAAVKSEIDLIHTALMNYKNEYGSFPPANMGPTSASNASTALWVSDAVNVRHPVYRHLVRVFPRINEVKSGANSPYKALSQMSPAQALVFWLNGFYQNPEFPLTNSGQPGNRKKLFEFEQARLYAASQYTPGTAQQFRSINDPSATAFEREYPVYFPPNSNSGLPYVYFDSRCYDTSPAAGQPGDISFPATSLIGGNSTAYPYFSSSPPANPTWAQLHMAAETFQLISPGPDGLYGSRPAAFPLAFAIPSVFGQMPAFLSGSIPSASDAVNASGHQDNQTNFAEKPLLDAAESLKPR